MEARDRMNSLSLIVPLIQEYFDIREFVSRELFDLYPEQILWQTMDPALLYAALQIRKDWDSPINCNTWLWGGNRTASGFREKGCNVGAFLSAHRIGRAFDLVPSNGELNRFHAMIESKGFKYGLTEMENKNATPGWCHVSTRPHFKKGFRIINP